MTQSSAILLIFKPILMIFFVGIHAREWISPAFLLYTATELVKNTALLQDLEFRLIPVLNPDGYVYSWDKVRWCLTVDGINV